MRYPQIKLFCLVWAILVVPACVLLLPRNIWKAWVGCRAMYWSMVLEKQDRDFRAKNPNVVPFRDRVQRQKWGK